MALMRSVRRWCVVSCGEASFSRSLKVDAEAIWEATSLGTPARVPLWISAFLTRSFSVCGAHPIFDEIYSIAAQRDTGWSSLSNVIRTARSRTSG